MEEGKSAAEKGEISNENLNKIGKTPGPSLTPLFYVFIFFSLLYIVSIILSLNVISKNKNLKISDISLKNVSVNKNKVAVIGIYGAIYKKDPSFSYRGSDLVVNLIKKYGEDKDIKAIVLDINSPGGSVGAVQEIYSMIKKIKEQYKKPIVAHFGEVAASGGYYIAMACDKIVSNSGTITGSIGVIFSTAEGNDLFKKIGLKTNTIKSGKFKDIGSFFREMTKEEKELLQKMIDDTYNNFIDVVAKGRKMDINKVRELSDGRIFTGNQAYQLNLVDKIGDLYDAIDEAATMAGIGKNPVVVRAKPGLFDNIFEMIDSKLSIFSFAGEDNYPKIEYRFSF